MGLSLYRGFGTSQALRAETRHAIRVFHNGQKIYCADMETGTEGDVPAYPTPDDLWSRCFSKANQWRDNFAATPLRLFPGDTTVRYYIEIAVNRAMDAIANGRDRILLTLATGTGKTFIAFQIAWKLFHSRWNLAKDGGRRPRILFLADRNILANQAYLGFSAFDDGVCVRIDPADITKKGYVPMNGSIFFTTFQTFMSGGSGEINYKGYPPDFFDVVIMMSAIVAVPMTKATGAVSWSISSQRFRLDLQRPPNVT